jgi:hypothetical protein
MKWFTRAITFFCFSLSLVLAGTSPAGSATSYYTIEGIDPGGVITDFAKKYIAIEKTGVTVKVDGLCASACTMVLAYLPADRICMTERGSFGFHLASSDGEDNPELTKAWFRIFPDWVLEWVVAHGGVEDNPMYAFAEDFKSHIGLCPGSHYPNIDMQKLIKTSDGERTFFKPRQ